MLADTGDGILMKDIDGRQWELGHLEYTEDLCSMNKLVKTLTKYNMEVAAEKAVLMGIRPENERNGEEDKDIQIERAKLQRVTKFNYLGSIIRDSGWPDGAIQANVTKDRRKLIELRPALRSKLMIRCKIEIAQTCLDPITTYGLETIVYRA